MNPVQLGRARPGGLQFGRVPELLQSCGFTPSPSAGASLSEPQWLWLLAASAMSSQEGMPSGPTPLREKATLGALTPGALVSTKGCLEKLMEIHVSGRQAWGRGWPTLRKLPVKQLQQLSWAERGFQSRRWGWRPQAGSLVV